MNSFPYPVENWKPKSGRWCKTWKKETNIESIEFPDNCIVLGSICQDAGQLYLVL